MTWIKTAAIGGLFRFAARLQQIRHIPGFFNALT
jgi:hypothetical protein